MEIRSARNNTCLMTNFGHSHPACASAAPAGVSNPTRVTLGKSASWRPLRRPVALFRRQRRFPLQTGGGERLLMSAPRTDQGEPRDRVVSGLQAEINRP